MKYVTVSANGEDILVRDTPTQSWKTCKVHEELVCFRPDELPELIVELQKALKKAGKRKEPKP